MSEPEFRGTNRELAMSLGQLGFSSKNFDLLRETVLALTEALEAKGVELAQQRTEIDSVRKDRDRDRITISQMTDELNQIKHIFVMNNLEKEIYRRQIGFCRSSH